MPSSPSLELATFTPHSALLALKSSVQRIELCSQRTHDGLTPSVQDYLFITSTLSPAHQEKPQTQTKTQTNTEDTTHTNTPNPSINQSISEKINIMIRPPPLNLNLNLNPLSNSNSNPHTNNFLIPAPTFEKMKQEIREFKKLGGRGFVFGILKEEEEEDLHSHKGEGKKGKRNLIIDQERCRELLKIAREGEDRESVRCTFHRAFDRIDRERMGEQLEVLINLSFTSLLTSGGSPTSTQGKLQIKTLVHQASGRIEIIVGGGVRSHNLKELIDETGAQWFHSSAVTGEGEEVDGEEVRRLREIMCTYGAGSVGNLL